MNRCIAVGKALVNVFLFSLYSIFAIVFGDFLYGLYVSKVLGKPVVGSTDPIHMKVAIFSVVLVFIVTFLLRKLLYLEVFLEDLLEEVYHQKKKNIKNEKNDDDLKIYLNKEI